MRELVLCLLLLGPLPTLRAQSHNLVTTLEPRVPVTDPAAPERLEKEKVQRTVSCYDGLGRLVREVREGFTPAGKDLVTVYTYDEAGRRERSYLPYAREAGSKDTRDSDPVEALYGYYRQPPPGVPATRFPYSRRVYDRSPLERVLAEGAPGKAWQPEQGHARRYHTTVNLEEVPHWTVDGHDSCHLEGSYPPGSLLVNEMRDEDGLLRREYIDRRGRTIMKERLLDTVAVRTFFVYDDRDLLRAVIPPMAAARGVADAGYVFRYTYDDRRRLVEKRLPGAAPEEMVYDNAGRLILFRDGTLRRDSLWRYTFRDVFGRVREEGLCATAGSRKTLQDRLDRLTGYRVDSSVFPGTVFRPHMFFFYDDYTFLTDTALRFLPTVFAGEDPAAWPVPFDPWERTERTKGWQTGRRVLVPATGQWLEEAVYYDILGRVIQRVRRNHLGGVDRYSYLYDLQGHTLKEVVQHTTGYGEEHTITKVFERDHAGRIVRVRYRLDTLEPFVLYEYSYNDLGLPVRKRLYGRDGHFAREIDYRYNVRGWLTRINDPDSLGGALFAEQLLFEDPAPYDVPARYAGPVAAVVWRSEGMPGKAAYLCRYDDLGRLTGAEWRAAGQGDHSVPLIHYDLNGNIDSIVRRGAQGPLHGEVIDALRYRYDGDQLLAVDDAANEGWPGEDFRDRGAHYDPAAAGENARPEYGYNAHGDMVRDDNKGILRIRYDINHLPREILLDRDRRIILMYDAEGTLLRTEIYDAGGHLAGVIDRDGEFVYVDGEPAWVMTEEGRLVKEEEGGWVPEYFLRDHLGNVRVVFRVDSAGRTVAVQETHYYPFGMRISGQSMYGTSPTANRYLYNGKELVEDEGLYWYDYGARFYDPALGRWGVPDPLAEQRYGLSRYQYARNDPLNRIDPNGALDDWYKSEAGNVVWKDSHEETITVNGETFRNIGKTYSQPIIEGGYMVYFQDLPIAITENRISAYQLLDNDEIFRNAIKMAYRDELREEIFMARFSSDRERWSKQVLGGTFAVPVMILGTITLGEVDYGMLFSSLSKGMRLNRFISTDYWKVNLLINGSQQLLINGPEEIDIWDLFSSCVFTPSINAMSSSLIDITPFRKEEKVTYLLHGKTFGEVGISFVTNLITGKFNETAITKIGPVNKFETGLLKINFSSLDLLGLFFDKKIREQYEK